MKAKKTKNRWLKLFLCIILVLSMAGSSVSALAGSLDTAFETGQSVEGKGAGGETLSSGQKMDEIQTDVKSQGESFKESGVAGTSESESESKKEPESESESEPESVSESESRPESESGVVPESGSESESEKQPERESETEFESEPESESESESESDTASESESESESESASETPEDVEAAAPTALSLMSYGGTAAPAHRKYIKDNGDGTYTLTLDVKGMYDSSTSKPKVDVVLIIDKSGSMDDSWGWRSTRLKEVKSIITKNGGLADTILNNENIDGRMAVVSFAGSQGFMWDEAWNDADIAQGWTDSSWQLNQSVNNIRANGGTNWQAGLRTAKKVLQSSRSDAQKIVIFLSDGDPTYYYNERGETVGNGSYFSEKALEAAKNEVAEIHGLNAFYTIGIAQKQTQLGRLQSLVESSLAAQKQAFSAATSDDLSNILAQITGEITEYTCRNVTITDTLSKWVEVPGNSLDYRVTAVDDESGRNVDIREAGINVTYNQQLHKVTAEFKKGYTLNKNYTYSISFTIQPSQAAYDEYSSAGQYPDTGSENSDAPGNNTSSGQPGFYSNNKALLTYTYGTESAVSQTVDYKEMPVVQVDTTDISVEKVWVGDEGHMDERPESIEVILYQDGTEYKTLQLNAANGWQGIFSNVAAKGHIYTVEELPSDGYISTVAGTASEGFTITNTYDRTEVTVTKAWEDNENYDKDRPERVTAVLYADGEKVENSEVTLSEANSWTHTWTKLDKTKVVQDRRETIVYTVEEVSVPEGYESHVSEGEGSSGSFTITNTRRPSLAISKEVTGEMGDKTKAFEFEITLTDVEGTPVTDTFSSTSIDDSGEHTGTVEFKDGKAVVTLRHGEQIIIKDLPSGASYCVIETNSGDYTVSYNGEADYGNENGFSGSLENCKNTVEVVNRLDKVPVTGMMDHTSAGFLFIGIALLLGVGTVALSLYMRKRIYRRR